MLGTFLAEKLWILNPEVDIIDTKCIACVALVARCGVSTVFVHALQESSLYDPFVLQASLTLSVNDTNPIDKANETLKRWKIVTSVWTWKDVHLDSPIGIDLSGLPHGFDAALVQQDPARIVVFQRLDTLQMAVPDILMHSSLEGS